MRRRPTHAAAFLHKGGRGRPLADGCEARRTPAYAFHAPRCPADGQWKSFPHMRRRPTRAGVLHKGGWEMAACGQGVKPVGILRRVPASLPPTSSAWGKPAGRFPRVVGKACVGRGINGETPVRTGRKARERRPPAHCTCMHCRPVDGMREIPPSAGASLPLSPGMRHLHTACPIRRACSGRQWG